MSMMDHQFKVHIQGGALELMIPISDPTQPISWLKEEFRQQAEKRGKHLKVDELSFDGYLVDDVDSIWDVLSDECRLIAIGPGIEPPPQMLRSCGIDESGRTKRKYTRGGHKKLKVVAHVLEAHLPEMMQTAEKERQRFYAKMVALPQMMAADVNRDEIVSWYKRARKKSRGGDDDDPNDDDGNSNSSHDFASRSLSSGQYYQQMPMHHSMQSSHDGLQHHDYSGVNGLSMNHQSEYSHLEVYGSLDGTVMPLHNQMIGNGMVGNGGHPGSHAHNDPGLVDYGGNVGDYGPIDYSPHGYDYTPVGYNPAGGGVVSGSLDPHLQQPMNGGHMSMEQSNSYNPLSYLNTGPGHSIEDDSSVNNGDNHVYNGDGGNDGVGGSMNHAFHGTSSNQAYHPQGNESVLQYPVHDPSTSTSSLDFESSSQVQGSTIVGGLDDDTLTTSSNVNVRSTDNLYHPSNLDYMHHASYQQEPSQPPTVDAATTNETAMGLPGTGSSSNIQELNTAEGMKDQQQQQQLYNQDSASPVTDMTNNSSSTPSAEHSDTTTIHANTMTDGTRITNDASNFQTLDHGIDVYPPYQGLSPSNSSQQTIDYQHPHHPASMDYQQPQQQDGGMGYTQYQPPSMTSSYDYNTENQSEESLNHNLPTNNGFNANHEESHAFQAHQYQPPPSSYSYEPQSSSSSSQGFEVLEEPSDIGVFTASSTTTGATRTEAVSSLNTSSLEGGNDTFGGTPPTSTPDAPESYSTNHDDTSLADSPEQSSSSHLASDRVPSPPPSLLSSPPLAVPIATQSFSHLQNYLHHGDPSMPKEEGCHVDNDKDTVQNRENCFK